MALTYNGLDVLEQGYQNSLQSPGYYKGLWTTTPASSAAPAGGSSNWFQNLGGWKGVGGAAAALGTTIGNARYGVYDYADPTYWMADGRESTVGNTMNGVGVGLFQAGVQTGNPMLMAIGGGAKAIGGLWNSAFGVKRNKDNIAMLDSTIAGMNDNARSFASAGNNSTLMNNWDNSFKGFDFGKSFIGKDGWFTNKIGKEYKSYKNQMSLAGDTQAHGFSTGVDNVQKKNRDIIANSIAFGGPLDTGMSAVDYNFMSDWIASRNNRNSNSGSKLNFFGYPGLFAYGGGMHNHGADWSNGAVHIDAGQSHEENPNGGVQIGADREGTPNLVEEGEVIYNDYVYSNRIEMDNAAKERFHINKKRDITYAEMAKKLEKESEERPNDPVSKKALDTQMAQLAEEQERQKQEQKAAEAQQMFASLSPEEQVGLMQQLQAEEQAAAEQQMAEQQGMPVQAPIDAGAVPMQGMPMEQQPMGMEAQMAQDAATQEVPVSAYGGKVNRYAEGGPMSAEEELNDASFAGKGYTTSDAIFKWLQGKYLRISDAELRKLANEMAGIQRDRSKSEANSKLIANIKEELIRNNPELGSDNIAKLAIAIAENNPRFTGNGHVDLPHELNKFIPTFNFSYDNYEKYVKKLTDIGVDFDTALMLVSSKDKNFYKDDVNSKRRRIQYEDKLRNKFTAQSNADAPAAQSQTASQYTGIPTPLVGLDNVAPYSSPAVVQDAAGNPVGIVPASDETAPIATYTTVSTPSNAAASSTGSTPRTGSSSSNSTRRTSGIPGLTAYGYYTNGTDGYSTPTGFTVDSKGRASGYTQGYLDLVNSLGADDIRAWAAQHPDDPSLKSFIARGNSLDNLTDAQWRRGATDGKYGFMHHVADTMLNSTRIPFDLSLVDRDVNENAAKDIMNGVSVTPTAPSAVSTDEEGNPRIVMNHRATWPRYAGLFGPAVGLGMMAAGIGKPDYSSLDAAMEGYNRSSHGVADYKPIGNYLTYRPMDIWSEQNRLNANAMATNRAIANSGMTAGSRMAGLLANDYNNQIGSAELGRKALEYNDALNKQVADFNRGTDMFNAQAYNQTSLANAHMLNQDRQFRANLAADIARTKMNADNNWYNSLYGNVAGLFKGLSDLGRENYMYNQAVDTLGSGAYPGVTREKLYDAGLGRYVTPEEYEKLMNRKNRRGLTFLT